jgi:hypothetical protein
MVPLFKVRTNHRPTIAQFVAGMPVKRFNICCQASIARQAITPAKNIAMTSLFIRNPLIESSQKLKRNF